jgi:hypothetical protein
VVCPAAQRPGCFLLLLLLLLTWLLMQLLLGVLALLLHR